MSRTSWLGTAVLLALLLPGCKVGPDYVVPEVEMPDLWHHDLTEGLEQADSKLHIWWTYFDDPLLNDLMERAREGNLDVKQAVARIEQARAMLGISRGDLAPQIGADGRAMAFEFSDSASPAIIDGNRFKTTGVDASWELDFWGRVRRNVDSFAADAMASVELWRDTLVVLFSDVARNYTILRTMQQRARLAEVNAELQERTLQLTRDRVEAEISSELDVRQAELNLARTRATIPVFRIFAARAIHRIAVLLGEHPGKLHAELDEVRDIPSHPDDVDLVLPAELLRRRPDVRAAERRLAAQSERIGVATAEMYPRFKLFGDLGLAAGQGSLFKSDSLTWTLGVDFQWRLFENGRIQSEIAMEKARTEELVSVYEETVLQALEETENALVDYAQRRLQREDLRASVTAAQQSVKLVQVLYTNGVTDFQNVLDMQRSLREQQDRLAMVDGLIIRSLVKLYKALGGGWDPDAQPATAGEGADESGGGEKQ